jgi:DNA topoisomerase-1
VARKGSKSEFLGCSGWPECDYTSPMPTGIHCPKCGGDVVKVGGAMKGRRPFYGCSNYATTRCDFRLYQTPVAKPCPKCAATFLVEAGGKTRPVLKCVVEGCGYDEPLEATGGAGEGEEPAAPEPTADRSAGRTTARRPGSRKKGVEANA